MSEKKVAVYTGTRNLYPHMIPAVKSLIANSDVDKIYLLIEDDEFPYELPDIVETNNISNQTLFPPNNPNARSRFTYMAMIRTAFTKIFPDLDRILSLDVDTIAIKDVSEVWDIPLDGYYFAAVEGAERDGWNAGCMLQNLKMLRETHMDDKLIDRLNREEIKFLDQTVYNQMCVGNVYNMNPSYNVNEYCLPTNDPRIIHYAGRLEWFNEKEYLDYNQRSWEEVLALHAQRCNKV